MAILVLKDPIPNARRGRDYVDVWNADVRGDTINEEFTLVGWGDSGPVGTSNYDWPIFHAA